MRLHFWQHEGRRNFGDMLNPWLWPKLIPDLLEHDDGTVLVGIGTVLNVQLPDASRTVVVGAGAGYGALPNRDSRWLYYAVRGPLTQELLQLPGSVPLGDPGVLVSDFWEPSDPPEEATQQPLFIPHWTTAGAQWEEVCAMAGIRWISPLAPVQDVLVAIANSSVVLAEAMHAAIVADTLRKPWIPVHSDFDDFLPFKWQDWAKSLNLDFSSRRISKPPWSPPEWKNGRPRALAKTLLDPARKAWAATRIRRAADHGEPMLSRKEELERCKADLYGAVRRLRRDFGCAQSRSPHQLVTDL